jgi:adenosylcobinamide kinase/adenosylcobinamide-phosphate guanylyltransferase
MRDERGGLTLITGPTRSGKSRFAESLAARKNKPVVYVATAARDEGDPEWVARIEAHRARRPIHWATLETAHDERDLATIVATASSASLLIIESLGTWLAAIVSEFVRSDELDAVALEEAMHVRSRALLAALDTTSAEAIVVSEQTGWGVVPAYPSARIFSSVLGRLTTTLARRAARSYLIVSGFAIDLHANATLLDIEENL